MTHEININHKLAKLVFPDKPVTDPEVIDDIEFLQECIRFGTIMDRRRFERIFFTIPKQSIREAINKGITVTQLINDSAQLQNSLLRQRDIHDEARTVNRVKPLDGTRHRRGMKNI